MTEVACVGDCCLDVYLAPVGRVLVGGSCLNVAVGLQLRGVEAAYTGPIGDDAAGLRVLALLSDCGVDASHARRVTGARTAVTDILLEAAGERRFLHEDYAIQESYAPSEDDWAWLAAIGVVHSSRMPQHLEHLRALGASGARVSYDFTTDPVPDRLDGLDVVFVPAEALRGRQPAEAAADLVARGAACAVVTRGALGALAATREAIDEVAAVPLGGVVDTCGAGDAFIAAFLAERLAGASLEACLAAGAHAGAAACTHLGAVVQQGFPLD